jgi:hypothetical protein
MKYIIVEPNGFQTAILFSEYLLHGDVAGDRKVVGAGFVKIIDGQKCEVYGKSTGLGIKAKESDAEIIQNTITQRL